MIREIFFRDFGWKLFSLLLAGFIWFTVHKLIEEPRAVSLSPANSVMTYREVPVSIVASAADPRLFLLNSNLVAVTVSGPPGAMAILDKPQIHALVNLSEAGDPARNLDRPVEVSVPWGVTVISVEPAKLRVIPPKK
jgi:hypothetical protein